MATTIRAGDWMCPNCNVNITGIKSECRKCHAKRPDASSTVAPIAVSKTAAPTTTAAKKAKVVMDPIKYLKLILDRRIFLESGEEGHITFMYFGKVAVEPEVLTNILKGMPPFTLTSRGLAKMGSKDNEVDAIAYDINKSAQSTVETIRSCLLRVLGSKVEAQNYVPYQPHVTKLTVEGAKQYKTFKVMGIESNDGASWKLMFPASE